MRSNQGFLLKSSRFRFYQGVTPTKVGGEDPEKPKLLQIASGIHFRAASLAIHVPVGLPGRCEFRSRHTTDREEKDKGALGGQKTEGQPETENRTEVREATET